MQKRLGFSRAFGALLAATLTVLPTPAGAIPTLAVEASKRADQPAMWVVSDSDTTIYLFGTFHALDQKTDWFARNVRAAFDSSEELILETLVPSDPHELHRILAAREMSDPKVIGAPVVAAPGGFAASARQAMAAGKSAGLSVDSGADAVLRRTADAEGKAVDGLESFEAQLAMFTALPAALPAASAGIPVAAPDARQAMIEMRSAWRRGDCTSFAAVLERLQAQSPGTYERLFVERNDQWAEWIARRMADPGTIFVAVGAGHLIGPDSVQQKLALRGYRSTRIY